LVAEGSVGQIKEATRPCRVGDLIDLVIEEQHLHNRNDAISRLDGYIVQILGGGKHLDERVKVRIKSVSKTSAIAEIIT
jgi:ribonuclease G